MRDGPDKNPFRSVSDLLSRGAPANRILHFLSYLIDLVLVFIVSFLLFLGGRAIVSNSNSYKTNNARYEDEITYYQDLIVDANLAVYIDRDAHELVDNEDLAVKMAISQVILSATKDDPLARDFIDEDPSKKLKEIYIGTFYEDAFTNADFTNDYVAKFFMNYVPTHNENNELVNFGDQTPQQY